jgi:dTDP-4-dehydrorhamnose reductase
MRRLLSERTSISVVNDQFGNPTYAPDLARGIFELVQTRPSGVYHLTNSGSTSWHGWASEIARLTGSACEVAPIAAAEYPRAATPPANGVLAPLAWPEAQTVMPHWRDALARCLR